LIVKKSVPFISSVWIFYNLISLAKPFILYKH